MKMMVIFEFFVWVREKLGENRGYLIIDYYSMQTDCVIKWWRGFCGWAGENLEIPG